MTPRLKAECSNRSELTRHRKFGHHDPYATRFSSDPKVGCSTILSYAVIENWSRVVESNHVLSVFSGGCSHYTYRGWRKATESNRIAPFDASSFSKRVPTVQCCFPKWRKARESNSVTLQSNVSLFSRQWPTIQRCLPKICLGLHTVSVRSRRSELLTEIVMCASLFRASHHSLTTITA